MNKLKKIFLLLLLALTLPGLAEDVPSVEDDIIARGDMIVTKDLLVYQVTKPGEGAVAKSGDRVQVHYTGWLVDGTKFDSSLDRNQPFVFNLGAGQVIRGWDRGVAGMKVGETRELIIPANMAYGKRGAGELIPPDSILLFEVKLLGIK